MQRWTVSRCRCIMLVMIFASFSDSFKYFHTADVFAALVRASIRSRHVIVLYNLFCLFVYSAEHRKRFFCYFRPNNFGCRTFRASLIKIFLSWQLSEGLAWYVHDNDNVLGLGGIDLIRCCVRASTETCYCQYIHNMLLWAFKKYCKYNIHEITPIAYMNHLLADLYRWSWGRWRVSEARCETATKSTSHIFECWAESSLATDTEENQSAVPCDNDVIRSDWVRPIGLRHLEFHDRTLYIPIESFKLLL